MKDDADSEKRQQIHHIQNLYAFNLFCQKRFDESMQVFAKLGTGKTFFTHYAVLSKRGYKHAPDGAAVLTKAFSVNDV